MNGPQHYAESERLLKLAGGAEGGTLIEAAYLAEAQIHAMLAMTAATISAGCNVLDDHAWDEVLKHEYHH